MMSGCCIVLTCYGNGVFSSFLHLASPLLRATSRLHSCIIGRVGTSKHDPICERYVSSRLRVSIDIVATAHRPGYGLGDYLE